MLRSPVPCLLAAAACSLLGSCAFHSTAKRWNGHLDAAGQPMFLLTSTYWGANFGIGLPWFGNTTIDKIHGIPDLDDFLGDRLRDGK